MQLIKKIMPGMMEKRRRQKMLGLVSMVEKTQEVELSCDDVLAVIDEYTERALTGEDVSKYMPQVKHHLDLCPECYEEYQVLLNILPTAPNMG
jgi:hypothetical protein